MDYIYRKGNLRWHKSFVMEFGLKCDCDRIFSNGKSWMSFVEVFISNESESSFGSILSLHFPSKSQTVASKVHES